MKLLAITLLAFLAVSALAVEDESYYTLQQIENTKFGKTLLDTIQLQLMSGDPVEDLIHMLQEIEDNLENEQDADDAYIEKLQHQCDDELERLEQEIEAARARSKELQAELNVKIPIRDEKVKLRADKNEFAHLIQDKITDLDARKIVKDEEWATIQEEHDRAQYVIERAKDIIQQSMVKGAFLQKGSNAFVQVSAHFEEHAKKSVFKKKSWNSIFRLLAQITASAPVQANQDSVGRIISLCDELLNKIAESREIERRSYNHWVDEYKQNRQGQLDKLEEVQAQIAQLDNEIATLNKRISNAQQEKAEQDERAKQKKTQHDEKLKYCDDENIQYAERRQQRHNDREVVSQTIGLLQAKLRLFRKYVNDRMKKEQKKKF